MIPTRVNHYFRFSITESFDDIRVRSTPIKDNDCTFDAEYRYIDLVKKQGKSQALVVWSTEKPSTLIKVTCFWPSRTRYHAMPRFQVDVVFATCTFCEVREIRKQSTTIRGFKQFTLPAGLFVVRQILLNTTIVDDSCYYYSFSVS